MPAFSGPTNSVGQRNLSHLSISNQPPFLVPFQLLRWNSGDSLQSPSAAGDTCQSLQAILLKALSMGLRQQDFLNIYVLPEERETPFHNSHRSTTLKVPVVASRGRHSHPTLTPLQWGRGVYSTLVTNTNILAARLLYNFQLLPTSSPQSRWGI